MEVGLRWRSSIERVRIGVGVGGGGGYGGGGGRGGRVLHDPLPPGPLLVVVLRPVHHGGMIHRVHDRTPFNSHQAMMGRRDYASIGRMAMLGGR